MTTFQDYDGLSDAGELTGVTRLGRAVLRGDEDNPGAMTIITTIGGATLKGLGRRHFNTAVRAQRRLMGRETVRNWWYLATILKFMIKHELRFRNMKPSTTFNTPLKELDLPDVLRITLEDLGLLWAELLAIVTQDELRAMGVEDDDIARIKAALKPFNLSLESD